MKRYLGPIGLFIAAFVVFYFGLFVGLQVSSNGGSLLVLLAAALGLGGIAWIIRIGRK